MKKYIYAIVALAAMLASCSQDAELIENVQPQSKAITQVGASTSAESRAVVSSTDQTKVNWESDDQLGVYGTGASGAVAYTLIGAAGSTSGAFKNDASTITAIQAMMYPYQSTATFESSKLTCEIPTVQTATADSFDKNAAIMYHIGNKTNPTLSHAVAFLKVNIPSGTTNVHAITVYSTTALSGKVDITSSGVAAALAGSETYVTLQADGSNGALTDNKDYYIAVLPGTLADLSITYKYTDHTAKAKQSSNSLTIEAGHVKRISANFATGTVHQAVQLWAGGPYFALFNIGATITDYSSATSYDEANVGGFYTWNTSTPTTQWGSAWRMPTLAELDALISNTNSTWLSGGEGSRYVTNCTLAGRKYEGNGNYNSNSVFFPAAGYIAGSSVTRQSITGAYWSSSLGNRSDAASILWFEESQNKTSQIQQSRSLSVRAVLK